MFSVVLVVLMGKGIERSQFVEDRRKDELLFFSLQDHHFSRCRESPSTNSADTYQDGMVNSGHLGLTGAKNLVVSVDGLSLYLTGDLLGESTRLKNNLSSRSLESV